MIKAIGITLGACGFFLVLGAVGSDCDGKCGPGMSISDMMFYVMIGMTMAGVGTAIAIKENR